MRAGVVLGGEHEHVLRGAHGGGERERGRALAAALEPHLDAVARAEAGDLAAQAVVDRAGGAVALPALVLARRLGLLRASGDAPVHADGAERAARVDLDGLRLAVGNGELVRHEVRPVLSSVGQVEREVARLEVLRELDAVVRDVDGEGQRAVLAIDGVDQRAVGGGQLAGGAGRVAEDRGVRVVAAGQRLERGRVGRRASGPASSRGRGSGRRRPPASRAGASGARRRAARRARRPRARTRRAGRDRRRWSPRCQSPSDRASCDRRRRRTARRRSRRDRRSARTTSGRRRRGWRPRRRTGAAGRRRRARDRRSAPRRRARRDRCCRPDRRRGRVRLVTLRRRRG